MGLFDTHFVYFGQVLAVHSLYKVEKQSYSVKSEQIPLILHVIVKGK